MQWEAGSTQPLTLHGVVGQDGALTEHCPPLWYPQHRMLWQDQQGAGSIGVPSGVPSTKWGDHSLPLHLPAGPCTLGWLLSAPHPKVPSLARKPPVRRLWAGRKSPRRVLTLSFPHRLRAAAYTAPDLQPGPRPRNPDPGTPTQQHSPELFLRDQSTRKQVPYQPRGLHEVHPARLRTDEAESSLLIPGTDSGHGDKDSSWGWWVYPHACGTGCVPQFPLHPPQDRPTPAMEVLQARWLGLIPGRMQREIDGEGGEGHS